MIKYSLIGAIRETRGHREAEKIATKDIECSANKTVKGEAIAKKKACKCIPVLPVTLTNVGQKLEKYF